MKKLLFVVPLLLASVVSFASQPQPQNVPTEKAIAQPSVAAPDWLIVINDGGTHYFRDGRDCTTVIVNTSGCGYWSGSSCP
jgi:hypothetical protein